MTEEYVSEIEERHHCHTCGQPYVGECQNTELHRKIERFRNTERPKVDAQQWHDAHAGTCTAGQSPCGRPARLYATGWRCDQHVPQATDWTGVAQ
jgi:hypothetical protein